MRDEDEEYCLKFPLHAAARDGNWGEVIFLIREGTHVDVPDQRGRTPLHWAATRGHSSTITALLGYNALVDLRADDGKTPLDYAAENERDEALRLLQLAHYHNRNKRPQ